MALFSDNPFVGVFRAQKKRADEAALAAQQAMKEHKQQKQKASMEGLKAEAEFQAENPGVRELQGLSQQNETYAFRAGGDSPWAMKSKGYGTTDPVTGRYVAQKVVPVFDPRKYITPEAPYRGPADKRMKAPTVIPAGFGSKQEYAYLTKGKEAGVDYVEAPEKFVRGKGTSERDRRGQFYSEVTGKPMGTIMGRGSYKGFGKEAQPPQQPTLAGGFGVTQSPFLTQATQLNKSDLGQSGSPLAFTGFGQMARYQKADQYQTPIGLGLSSMNTLGVQRFPFAGAESAFERSARNATTFGGMQMFPYAGY